MLWRRWNIFGTYSSDSCSVRQQQNICQLPKNCNSRWNYLLMPTGIPFACECCGGVCTCTLVTCTRQWTGGMAGTWEIIASCGSAGGVVDGLDRPCCGCPIPSTGGTYGGEQITAPCTAGISADGCNCSTCTATWSTVLDDWILSSCSVGGASNRCTCPTQAKPTPRPSNGYVISPPITCSC